MIYFEFIQLFIWGIIALYASYFIGKTVVAFYEITGNFFFKLFVSYLIGITSIILCYSIFQARGKTVNILLLPTILYLLYVFKNRVNNRLKFDVREIGNDIVISTIVFLCMYLYQSWFYFDFANNSLKSLYADSYWYSSYGDSIHFWGSENFFTALQYFFPGKNNGLIPYHYQEFWLSSLSSRIFGISTLQSNYLLVSPMLISIYVIGIASIISRVVTNFFFIFLLAISIVFTCGLTFSFYNQFHLLTYSSVIADVSPMGLFGLKYIFILPYILLAFILLIDENETIALIIFISVPLFYVGLVPAIWGGLILYFSYRICFKNNISKTSYIKPILLFGIVILSYFLFYSFFKSKFSNDFALSFAIQKFYKNGHIIFVNCIPFIKNIIAYWIKIFVLFFAVFLVLPSLIRKHKNIVLLSFLMIFCGIIMSSFYLGFSDGNQFANNSFILLPIIFILGIYSLFKSNQNRLLTLNRFIFLCLCIVFGFSIIWNFTRKSIGKTWFHEDAEFLKNVSKTVSENNNFVLVFLDSVGFKKNNYLSWHVHNDIYMLKQYSHKNIIFTLGNPELYCSVNSLSSVDSFNYYSTTPLVIWRQKHNINYLKTFIEHYNIRFFYFKANVTIPEFIMQHTTKIIKSSVTQSTFYICKF